MDLGRDFKIADGTTNWTDGGVIDGLAVITQDFHAVQYTADGTPYLHQGLDEVVPEGTPLLAVFGGTVDHITTEDQGTDYGNSVWINLDGGGSIALFHMSQILVSPGQRLEQNDVLGYSGHTGFVRPPGPAGAHVHIQCSLGPVSGLTNTANVIDPIAFLTMIAARQAAPPAPLTAKDYAVLIEGYAEAGVPSTVLASMLKTLIGMI